MGTSFNERWNRFLTEWGTGALAYKRFLEITIYGSYFPLTEKERLLDLKQFLIERGYISTKLVDERPNPRSLDAWGLSKACLVFSDVNFLVFTHAGKRHGVIRELAYCRDSFEMLDRRWRCVVFEEILDNRSALPKLSSEDIDRLQEARIRRVEFENDDELKNLAAGMAFRYLKDLAEYLRTRI